MSDCPGLTPDETGIDPACLACGYDMCGTCENAHALPGASFVCLPCARTFGEAERAEVLEASAIYVRALENLRADPSLGLEF